MPFTPPVISFHVISDEAPSEKESDAVFEAPVVIPVPVVLILKVFEVPAGIE